MAVYKLVLAPRLADNQMVSAAQQAALIDSMRAERFLSPNELKVDGITRYLLGDACMSQLTFLGCSPYIELDPPTEDPEAAARQGKFCHLTISQFDTPVWRVDPTAKPRCPCCRKASRQQDLLITDHLACPQCHEISLAKDWHWRSLAGRGRFFLDIWGVFTSEAVPNPEFLNALATVTESEWHYFYVKD